MNIKLPLRDKQQEEPKRVCPVCGAELADDQMVFVSNYSDEAIGCQFCVSSEYVADYFG